MSSTAANVMPGHTTSSASMDGRAGDMGSCWSLVEEKEGSHC